MLHFWLVTMNNTLEIFFHSAYVAFVFSVLYFGALIYRQIIDRMEVRKLQMGEDRDAYIDAVPAGLVCLGIVVLVPLGILCYGVFTPSIYTYALPLVVGIQCVQLGLRTLFQRTLIKTRGLVVRSVLFDRVKAIPFADIIAVRLTSRTGWVDVRVSLPTAEIGFRIFSFSAKALEQQLQRACGAPVLWTLRSGKESHSHHKQDV